MNGILDEITIYDRDLTSADSCNANAGSRGQMQRVSVHGSGLGRHSRICRDNCPFVSNPAQIDADNDFYGEACDCNDANAAINPNAIEKCDGVDNDCDLAIDDPYLCGNYSNCEGIVIEAFAQHIPVVAGITISRGGTYGDYIYFTVNANSYNSAAGDTVFRIDPSGNVSFFGTIPPGSANIDGMVLDNTPQKKYGGYLYAIGDKAGVPPPNQGCIQNLPRWQL